MDLGYMGRLLLSFAIFAPGLILLAFLLFVGAIMLAEKANLFRGSSRGASDRARELLAQHVARNPAPGPIASALTDELEAAGKADKQAPEAKGATVHSLRKHG